MSGFSNFLAWVGQYVPKICKQFQFLCNILAPREWLTFSACKQRKKLYEICLNCIKNKNPMKNKSDCK